MDNNDFKDYYKILQVHYDASPEVIFVAYERLTESDDSLKDLFIEAYQILSDPDLRKKYHKLWALFFTEQMDQLRMDFLPYMSADDDSIDLQDATIDLSGDSSAESSMTVMDSFYNALQYNDFSRAYFYISEEDKEVHQLEDIENWREAYQLCYHFDTYKIEYTRTYSDCKLDRVLYDSVIEYKVTINSRNLNTSELTTDTLRRCTAFDGTAWKVWIGNVNVKATTLKYLKQAEENRSYINSSTSIDPDSRQDSLTGMLNEVGFYETALFEVARTKRYSNPFTLLAFHLHCDNKDRESSCIYQLSSIIKKALRVTDIAARLDNNQIICLLTETRKFNGDAAANRFLKLVNEQQSEQYALGYGVVFFGGFTELKDAVSTACAIAACSPNALS